MWRAFWWLSATDRPFFSVTLSAGLSGTITVPRPAAIPFTAIRAFARQYGWDGADAFPTFETLIHAMDAEWLDVMADRDSRGF